MFADLVLLNGKIATVDDKFTIVEAIAAKDGRIIDTDTNERVKAKIGPGTKVIDLEGKTALPGACDSHMHAVSTGFVIGLGELDLQYVKSIEDLRQRLKRAASRTVPGEWIFASGILDYEVKELLEEGRSLTKDDIDPVTPENPVAIIDGDHHTLIVNSKALEVTGFDKKCPELKPEEGLVCCGEDGLPNGRFEEYGAINLISRHIPVLTDAELEDCIIRMQKLLNSHGITSHTDILGAGGIYVIRGSWGDRAIHAYKKLQKEGKLTARVNINYFAAKDGIHKFDSIMEGISEADLAEISDGKWVQKIKSIKLFGDKMDIWDEEGVGRSMFPGTTEAEQIAEIERTVAELHKRGFQILTHAIGGKMTDVIIGAYVKAQEENPREDPRHFIIHGDGIDEGNMHDMKKHGVGLSCQPISFPGLAELHIDMMGDEVFNWQMYTDEGIVCAGGSDYSSCGPAENVSPVSWLEGLQYAMTRETVKGRTMRGDLGMRIEDGIRMYTICSAKQDKAEAWRGSLEPGKVADIQVLGQDIFSVPKGEIKNIPIVMTIVDGKVVYEA